MKEDSEVKEVKTAEQILRNHYEAAGIDTFDFGQIILTAMEEYASLRTQQLQEELKKLKSSELSTEELSLLKSVGIIAANWYAVCYPDNTMPIALFADEESAKAYRDQFTATSIVEPWPMILRDLRKGRSLTT